MTKCGLQITNPNTKYKLKNPKRKNAKQTQKKQKKKKKLSVTTKMGPSTN